MWNVEKPDRMVVMRTVLVLWMTAAAISSGLADEPRTGHRRHGHGGAGGVERSEADPFTRGEQRPDEVVELMVIVSGMTVADLGAGTGYFLSRLDAAVGERGRVLALDVDPELVAYMTDRAAREHLGAVEARVVEHDDPALDAASVDRVLVVDTWHHLPDRGAYARRLAAALRPGGAVVVVDLELDAPLGPPRDHRLEAEEVVEELEAGGLEARVVEEQLPYQYVVIARHPRSR